MEAGPTPQADDVIERIISMANISAGDIKRGGGKCEKVATDFWECTGKDGKVWWCSNGGRDCVSAPISAGGGWADVGRNIRDLRVQAFERELAGENAKGELPKALRKISSAARKTLSGTSKGKGYSHDCGALDETSQRFARRIDELLAEAVNAERWNDTQLAFFARDLGWAKLTADIGAIALRQGGGGGGGGTCVTRCAAEYNQCMLENGCTSSFICLCCIPCSLQYMGCVAGCTMNAGGFAGFAQA
jgi:hypothetical protein